MTDKLNIYAPNSHFEEVAKELSLDANEIEMRLAVAEFVITPAVRGR